MERVSPAIKRKAEYNIGWNDAVQYIEPKYSIFSKLLHLEYFLGYDEGKRYREKSQQYK